MENEIIEVKNLPDNANNDVKPTKRKITKKAIIVCALAFALCIAACIAVLFVVFAPKDYIKQEYLWMLSDKEVYCDETCVKTLTEDPQCASSIDGRYAMILDGETLYVGSGEKKTCKQIATGVKIAAISASGNAISYVNSDRNLCLYKIKTNKTKTLDRDVDDEYLVISPKGKSVAYTKTEDDVMLFAWEGKAKKLDDDLTPVAITDDAKTIYARKLTNGAFYSYNMKGKNVKLAEEVDTIFLTNYYGNEVIFISDGYAHIAVDGKESEELFEADLVYLINPQDVDSENGFRYMDGIYETSPYKSFKDNYFQVSFDMQCNVCYINEDYEGSVIVSDAFRTQITANRRYVFYLNEKNELSKYSVKKDTSSVIAENVDDFGIDKNAKHVYALDKDSKLGLVKKDKKIKEIVSGVDAFAISNKKVYFQTDSNENFIGTVKQFKVGSKKITTIDKELSILGKFSRFLVMTDAEGHYIFKR